MECKTGSINKDTRNQAYKLIAEEMVEPNFEPFDVAKIKNVPTTNKKKKKVEIRKSGIRLQKYIGLSH